MLFHGFTPKKGLISSGLFLLVSLVVNIYLLWTWKMADYVLLASLESSLIFTLFIGYWSALNVAEFIPLSSTNSRTIQKAEVSHPSICPPSKISSGLGFSASILLLLIVISVVVQQSIETTDTNIMREVIYHRILSNIQLLHLEDTEQKALIISPAFGIPWEWSNPMFIDFPDAPHYMVMDWDTFSPAYYSVLRGYQVEFAARWSL